MTSKLYLDTSAIIAIDEGRVTEDWLEKIDSSTLYTSFFVYIEICQYCLKKKIDSSVLLETIKSMSIEVNLTSAIASEAAIIRDSHRKKKTKFGSADAVHYTCSKEVGATLLTFDKDFIGLYGVEVLS